MRSHVLKRIRVANLILASAYGAVLFILVYASAWQMLSTNIHNCPRQFDTWLTLTNTVHAVAKFQKDHGKLPADLTVPEIVEHANRPETDAKLGPLDGWGNPLKYEVHGDKFTICSLGRDGRPGGVGLDADYCGPPENDSPKDPNASLFLEDPQRPTFWQFVTVWDPGEIKGNNVLMWAALCAALAFGLMRVTSGPLVRQARDQKQIDPALIARYEKIYAVFDPHAPVADRAASLLTFCTNAIVLILASMLFAAFITFMHFQSGH